MNPASLQFIFEKFQNVFPGLACCEEGCVVLIPRVAQAVSEYLTILAEQSLQQKPRAEAWMRENSADALRNLWMDVTGCADAPNPQSQRLCSLSNRDFLVIEKEDQKLLLSSQCFLTCKGRLILGHDCNQIKNFQLEIAAKQDGHAIRATAPHVDPNAAVNIFTNADGCVERFNCPNGQSKIYDCTEQFVPFRHYLQQGTSSCDQLPPDSSLQSSFLPQIALGAAILLTVGIVCKVALRYFSQKPEIVSLAEEKNSLFESECNSIREVLGQSCGKVYLDLLSGQEAESAVEIVAEVVALDLNHCDSLKKLGWIQQTNQYRFIKEGSPRMVLRTVLD